MAKLNDSQIEEFLGEHAEWQRARDKLVRTFIFDDFESAMAFVNRVATRAELAGHHPDIDIRWNKVTLTLSTHSEGGITQKDLDLAVDIEGLTFEG
jgi:4a-hydroxytetrahydrobiopterin dehydratase